MNTLNDSANNVRAAISNLLLQLSTVDASQIQRVTKELGPGAATLSVDIYLKSLATAAGTGTVAELEAQIAIGRKLKSANLLNSTGKKALDVAMHEAMPKAQRKEARVAAGLPAGLTPPDKYICAITQQPCIGTCPSDPDFPMRISDNQIYSKAGVDAMSENHPRAWLPGTGSSRPGVQHRNTLGYATFESPRTFEPLRLCGFKGSASKFEVLVAIEAWDIVKELKEWEATKHTELMAEHERKQEKEELENLKQQQLAAQMQGY